MRVVFEDVRVFTGDALTGPTRVVVAGDRIVAVGADGDPGDPGDPGAGGTEDRTVDGTGLVLLPGLVDAHVHVVQGRADLVRLAEWGVTTGLDMASWPATFVAAMRRQTGVADIRSATVPAVGPAGNHARMPGFPAEGVVTSPRQGRAFVARRVADGADYVKVVTEASAPEGPDEATVAAIVAASHEHGLLVVAHAVTSGAYRVALDAGVDVLTHAPVDRVLPDDDVRRMRESGTVCVPTLTMMDRLARLRAAAGLRYEHARDTVTALHEAGVRLLAGTDANSAPGAPASPEHGSSLHEELERLVGAGLAPVEALRAATSYPAETFALPDRGAVAPGRRADLVLLTADPVADVTATRALDQVWIAGERIAPAGG